VTAAPRPTLDNEVWMPLLQDWGRTWGTPGIELRIQLATSTRMTSALGRCRPARAEIKIAAALLDAPAAILEEVLCHESAHVAVHELHKRKVRPHGPEWKTLMSIAGYAPRVRMPADAIPGWEQRRARRRRWRHRCPVCQATRMAARPVYLWRCAACVGAGLDGGLVVTRLADGAAA